MSTNRDAFDRAIAAWNDGDLDRYLDLYDDSIRLHGYSPEPMTKAEAAGFYGQLFANLDDIHLDVEQVVEEGDTLAVHAVMSGTHTGELFGLTLPGYAITLLASAYVLWTFGRLDGLGFGAMLHVVLVLALPASVGAAAARLIL